MKENKMKAIILSAGIGKRSKQEILPKCLFKIGEETLLEKQINILKGLGIKDIVLVVGYQGKCWNRKNIERIKKIHKNTVINKKNIEFKRPYSLFRGLKNIQKEDIIVIDGDLIFEKDLIKKIIKDKRENLTLTKYTESKNIEDKGAKVISGKNDKIIEIGYGFPSSLLDSGIFKIGKKDFNLFKHILEKEKIWSSGMTKALEEFKKKANLYSLPINPSSSSFLEKKSKATESFKPTMNWIERKNNIIIKKTKTGKQRLTNEFNFIKSLPESAKKHFPKIIDYDFNKKISHYDMEYYPYPSFLDLIFDKKISVPEAIKELEIIFHFVFNDLYKINIKLTPTGFVRISYFNKVEQRFKSVKGKSALLDRIASADCLIINGKKQKNFRPILNEIKNDVEFLASLEPPFVTTYHGDFKFDNMLIDPGTNRFILIDPRGKSVKGGNESDIVEDIAKLFTSCHGYYDIFKRNLFDLKIKEGKQIEIDYELKAEEITDYFDRITNELLKLLPKYEQIHDDDNWKKRLFFIESILLIAVAPFQFTSKEKEKYVLALLTRGVELLNDFINEYPLNKNKKFNIVNINKPEDYDYAKSIFKK